MIHEYRTYQVAPGKMQALLDRFRDHTLKLFAKHGISVIGFWTSDLEDEKDQLIYLLQFADHDAKKVAWASFLADPEWHAVRAATDKGGPLVLKSHSRILLPTDISPLK